MGELAGQPNYFPEKIQHSLMDHGILSVADRHNYRHEHEQRFGHVWDWDCPKLNRKDHTIREDKNDRWKPGMDIHMVINNRTKNRFQFVPVVKCKSVQTIEIRDITHLSTNVGIVLNFPIKDQVFHLRYNVIVDGKILGRNAIIVLAIKDGFDSVEDFFAYFNKDFKGKIIHWTNLKY